MHKMQRTKKIQISLLLLAISLGGLGVGFALKAFTTSIPDQGSAFEGYTPKSLDELIQDSNLIIIGTLSSIVDRGTFYGYDVDAPKRAAIDKNTPASLGLPFVDYEIEVEHTFFGEAESTNYSPLILRVLDDPDISTSLATLRLGDRRLFFLKMNPDLRTYGLSSLVSQIDIDGPVAVYYQGSSAFLPFGSEMTPLELRGQIEERTTSSQNSEYAN